MTNIAELYSSLLIPDNNVISQATQALLSLYQSPDTIMPILEILKNSDNAQIRQHAAIGLKRVLKNHWYGFCTTKYAQSIIDDIITSLKNEAEERIRHLIIYALEPISAYRECPWPKMLDDLALQCIQSDDPAILDVGLHLYEILIPHFSEKTINYIIDPLVEKISEIFQNCINLVTISANLIALLFQTLSSPYPACLDDITSVIFDGFHKLLIAQFPSIYHISTSISSIISYKGSHSAGQFLEYLLQIANSTDVPPSFLPHVFTPMETIVKDYMFIDSKVQEYLPALLATVFKCTALAFQDDCILEQTDSRHIFSVLEPLSNCDEEVGNNIFSVFSEMISNSSVPEAFSSLLVFQFMIDNYPQIVSGNLKQIVTFLLAQSQSTCHHCLRELSMISFNHLINVVNGGLVEYSDHFLQSIMEAVSSDHFELSLEGLNAMAELFKIPFDHSLIPQILTLIQGRLQQTQELLNSSLLAINSLVFSAGTDISPFAMSIAPIFVQLIQMSETESPLLKSYAAEGLASLLKNAPEEMSSIAEQSIQMLIHQCSSATDYSVLDSTLSAFSILAGTQIPLLVESCEIAMQKSIEILQLECPVIMNTEKDDDNDIELPIPQEYDTKCAAMNFIISFTKSHPEQFAKVAEVCIKLLFDHVQCHETKTRITALKTLTTISLSSLLDPIVLLQQFLEMGLLELDDEKIVSKSFTQIRKLLQPTLPPQLVQVFIKYAISGLINKLPCQAIDECDNLVLIQSIFKFLSGIATTQTSLFPLPKVRKFCEQNAGYLVSYAIPPLAHFLIAIKQESGRVPMQFLQKIMQLIFSSLELCNGKVAPNPLFAIKELYKAGVLALLPQFLQPTFEAIDGLLTLPKDGQPFYGNTISAIVSLLFILFRLLGTNFDPEKYMNNMLSILPITYKTDATDIYISLMQIYSQFQQQLTDFVPLIIRGVSLTLALPNTTLSLSGMSEEMIQQLINFLKAIVSAYPQAQQIISESVKDELGQKRLMRVLQ